MNRSHIVGLAFISLQLFAIAYSRFIPERFFCWAPYDEHTRYEISVHINGEPLSRSEITDRYRYASKSWEVRSINNVISLVRQYEQTYGRADNAVVSIRYSMNGHPEQYWTWPEN